jgi:FtsZ-binding cell division protein ZapB
MKVRCTEQPPHFSQLESWSYSMISVPLNRTTRRLLVSLFLRRRRDTDFITNMGFITDILKEFPLSAVLKERLTEADMKAESLKEENANLRHLVMDKDSEIDRLKNKVESLKQPQAVPRWGSQQRIKGRIEL